MMPMLRDEPILPATTDVMSVAGPPVPRGLPRRVGIKQQVLARLASLCNACFGPREQQAFGILMYHRTANPPPGQPKPTWNVPPRRFEQQLQGLLARGWQAWPLRQVLDHVDRELPIPRKTFVVTFDDGYANNLTSAAPILTKLHVPATVFLATAYLDAKLPFPSDDWTAAGRPGVPSETWRPLTTEECRRLSASGLIELGAHTHTHADFRGRASALAEDLRRNLEVLRDRFGIDRPLFALPFGTKGDGFAGDEFTQGARQAGMACCLTTEAELVRRGDSPFDWGRFAAEEHDTAGSLAAKLGGWHTALRRLGEAALPKRRRAW